MARRPKSQAGPSPGQQQRPTDAAISDDEVASAGADAPDPHRISAPRLPSRQQILDFIAASDHKVGKREIAKAFNVKGGARIALKRLLADMSRDGALAGNRRELRRKGGLPPVTVIEITGRDDAGDLIAKPTVWNDDDGERPAILLVARHPDAREDPGRIGVGDKVLARITQLEDPDVEGFRVEAAALKRISREKRRLLGIFRESARGGGTIEPIERKSLRSWPVQKSSVGPAKDGDLVRFDLNRKARFANPQAEILESLGNPDDQRQISLIAVHAHGIPDDFPESVLAEAAACEIGRAHV